MNPSMYHFIPIHTRIHNLMRVFVSIFRSKYSRSFVSNDVGADVRFKKI